VSGLVLITGGLVLFTRAPVDGGYAEHVLPVMVLLGAGAGVSFPALMTLAMSGATNEDAGLASGLVNTSAQVGGALGLALLATLASTRTGALHSAGEPAAAALNGGFHLAYLIGAGLMAVAVVIAVVAIEPDPAKARARRRRSAEPCAEVA
jgi:MFS family permease